MPTTNTSPFGLSNPLDIFNDDAFTLTSLTAAINEMDHVPGRAGQLVFATEGVGQGIPTLTVAIERQGQALTLIPTSPRGAPAPKEIQDKRNLISFDVPQIKLEDTIFAAQVMDVHEFGTANTLRTVQGVVNGQLLKMTRRHDLTLEHHRLGALLGKITDADGTVLTDLFTGFDLLNSDGITAPETFDFNLDSTGIGFVDAIRIKCQQVVRTIHRVAKMPIPKDALVWAFCGDEFFDKLISHPSVKDVWNGFDAAESILRRGGNYAFNVFEFGGIFFENYRGTDDAMTVTIPDDEARFFLTGVPGLYAEYYAPADFLDTVNQPGLPRYARIAPDKRLNQSVELHTQQNPLPLCLRPRTLMRGTA